jgi:hypothetical protein
LSEDGLAIINCLLNRMRPRQALLIGIVTSTALDKHKQGTMKQLTAPVPVLVVPNTAKNNLQTD